MSNSEQVKQAIQENFKQMKAAMEAGNARELSMHFTKDAVLKLPEQELLMGREAIEKAHEQMIENGIGIKPETREVQVAGDMAFELGAYELLTGKGETIDAGHYASLWKREKDEWLLSRDIISSTGSSENKQ